MFASDSSRCAQRSSDGIRSLACHSRRDTLSLISDAIAETPRTLIAASEQIISRPDFTIEDDDAGITYLWEHCGMLHDPAYRRWREKKQHWYRDHGILPLEQGGGPKGTLVMTRDEPDGGIDSAVISALIARIGGH